MFNIIYFSNKKCALKIIYFITFIWMKGVGRLFKINKTFMC